MAAGRLAYIGTDELEGLCRQAIKNHPKPGRGSQASTGLGMIIGYIASAEYVCTGISD